MCKLEAFLYIAKCDFTEQLVVDTDVSLNINNILKVCVQGRFSLFKLNAYNHTKTKIPSTDVICIIFLFLHKDMNNKLL